VFTAPLFKRGTNWTIEGHLKGHKKSVNVCKFNPSLKKEYIKVGGNNVLSCSTYLATSGGDSNICIWKTGEKNPFFIIKKAFLAGVNDLTWGLEGNALFGCSNDGEVMVCHFLPGTLGEFLSESEKQEVFLRNYGEIVYSEYKKNSLINVIQIPLILPGQKQEEEKKQITSEGKLAKKRIIPIAEKTFTDVLDPHKFKFKYNKLENMLNEEVE
jgi:WD40 repeat protein